MWKEVISVNSNDKQEVRKEVVIALGEACKSPRDATARDALTELLKIKEIVFKEVS
jgi:hypothetical protein